jgi:hypothetical protein
MPQAFSAIQRSVSVLSTYHKIFTFLIIFHKPALLVNTLLILALPSFCSHWLFPMSVQSFSPHCWSCSWTYLVLPTVQGYSVADRVVIQKTGVPTGFRDWFEPARGSPLRFLRRWLQLCIWVMIVSWNDQYADCAVLAPRSSPAVRFAIGPIFVEWPWKKVIFLPKSAGCR